MTDLSNEELQRAEAGYQALMASQKTLQLSTYSEEQGAEISYAPFYRDDKGVFYVFLSELAAHTQNMMAQRQASLMLIQPEAECQNLFARERLTFNCEVQEINPDADRYAVILECMQQRLGKVLELLRTLPDFHLFALRPRSGQYVVGFGKAFRVDLCTGKLAHITKV